MMVRDRVYCEKKADVVRIRCTARSMARTFTRVVRVGRNVGRSVRQSRRNAYTSRRSGRNWNTSLSANSTHLDETRFVGAMGLILQQSAVKLGQDRALEQLRFLNEPRLRPRLYVMGRTLDHVEYVA